MVAAVGNTYARGYGRPRTLSVAVRRLREATEYVAQAVQQQIVAGLLAGQSNDEIIAHLDGLATGLQQSLSEAESLAAAIDGFNRGRRRKKGRPKTLGADSTDQTLMDLSRRLDRAVGRRSPQ